MEQLNTEPDELYIDPGIMYIALTNLEYYGNLQRQICNHYRTNPQDAWVELERRIFEVTGRHRYRRFNNFRKAANLKKVYFYG
jgi:hypothetical protein